MVRSEGPLLPLYFSNARSLAREQDILRRGPPKRQPADSRRIGIQRLPPAECKMRRACLPLDATPSNFLSSPANGALQLGEPQCAEMNRLRGAIT